MLYHRSLRRILVLIILLIVYGSLYPWDFSPKQIPGNPLVILFHALHGANWRFVFRDVVVNIALYIPLGFAAHSVFRRSRLPRLGFYGPVLLGMCLSIAVELTQLYTPTRNTSLVDVITNTIGSALGVVLAVLFERVAGPLPRASIRSHADRGALMLLFCWAAWILFPFFPVLGSYLLIRKAATFAASLRLSPISFLSAGAVWFCAGLLLAAAGIRRPVKWLAFSILAVPAQLFIASRQPMPSDLFGAAAGFLLFALRPRAKPVTRWEASAFLAVVVIRGLAPFRFVPAATDFMWIPFAGLLDSEWQVAVLTLLGKIFYYTSAIWLLGAAGARLWLSTAAVAAFLAAIEGAQTHLPGRTPESMDPLLALLMGFVLLTLFRETGKRFRSAG